MLRYFLACALSVAAWTLPATALDEDGWSSFLKPGMHAEWQEIRLGVLAYDRGPFSTDEFSGTVINGEYLFRSPAFLDRIGSPRPYIGVDFAIANDPIHFFYAGLNWDFRITDRFYLSASLGGAVTTAENLDDPTTYKALGCRVLVHTGAAIGYDMTDRWTVQAYTDHFSNAGLCGENNGAEATGIRIGYRF